MYKIIYFQSFIDVTNFASNHQELIDTTYHTLYLPWYMEEFHILLEVLSLRGSEAIKQGEGVGVGSFSKN